MKNLTKTGICTFKIIRRIGQLSLRNSLKKHPLQVVETNYNGLNKKQKILTENQQIIGRTARDHLLKNPCRYLLFVDDLEKDRVNKAPQVLQKHPDSEILEPFQAEQYHFRGGILSEVTRKQLDNMAENPTA